MCEAFCMLVVQGALQLTTRVSSLIVSHLVAIGLHPAPQEWNPTIERGPQNIVTWLVW